MSGWFFAPLKKIYTFTDTCTCELRWENAADVFSFANSVGSFWEKKNSIFRSGSLNHRCMRERVFFISTYKFQINRSIFRKPCISFDQNIQIYALIAFQVYLKRYFLTARTLICCGWFDANDKHMRWTSIDFRTKFYESQNHFVSLQMKLKKKKKSYEYWFWSTENDMMSTENLFSPSSKHFCLCLILENARFSPSIPKCCESCVNISTALTRGDIKRTIYKWNKLSSDSRSHNEQEDIRYNKPHQPNGNESFFINFKLMLSICSHMRSSVMSLLELIDVY